MSDTKQTFPLKEYSRSEENLNIISHALGILLGFAALILLLIKTIPKGNPLELFALVIYALSIITLFTASTLFHSTKEPKLRYKYNIFDHSAIYGLIAGTYTPYTLLTIQGNAGWIMFGVIWLAALGGFILKLFYTGRFRLLSTIMYVLMGWISMFAIKPLYHNLEFNGFILLLGGGLAYTLGALLYMIKKIPFNHAIFHFFVLLASLLHFLSIYLYVV